MASFENLCPGLIVRYLKLEKMKAPKIMLNVDFDLKLPDISLQQISSQDANLFHQQIKPLNMQAWQLSSGSFEGTVSQIATDKFRLDIYKHNSAVKYEGVTLNTWGFAIPIKPNLLIFEQKYELEDSYIMFGSPKAGFMGVHKLKANHGSYVFNITSDYLNTLCETLELPDPHQLLGVSDDSLGVVICKGREIKRLRQYCYQLEQTLLALGFSNHQQKQTILIANHLKQELEQKIAIQLLLTIAKARNLTPKKTIIRRSAILKQAEEYMLNNLKADINCQDICQAVGVSQRSIQDIFKHFYDVTPKAYLKRLRLNHLRQCLLQSSPKAKIWHFAEDLGFIHRGQLAKDYQQLFGELPSQTVEKY